MAQPLALTAYRWLGRGLAPFFGVLVALRSARGKEDPARRGERYGRTAMARPEGPLVWVHAASIGETNSVLPLINALAADGVRVLLTSGTVTSAAVAAKRLPAGTSHQFVPFDIEPFIARFLDHWRPDLALFVESELWPTTLAVLRERQIPRLLINGRMSDRSFRRWRWMNGPCRAVFGALDLVLAQTCDDADRFTALGVSHVETTGNLKFDNAPLAADPAALAALQDAVIGRPVWLAASTHPGEDLIVADTHVRLRAHHDGLITILVPRHPERGVDIADRLSKLGLTIARRGIGQEPTADIDLYIADTLGELGLFYRLAPISFIGGSLVERGGQNPIEAAQLGSAIVHGPLVANFRSLYAQLDASGAAETVTDAASLARAVSRRLVDVPGRLVQIEAASALVATHAGALARTRAALAPHLAALARDRGLVSS
jgi:3-deoxy-D-manno-octulosonic-acid transferase